MAIIKCPECGENVSDKAEVCIHCGYPLKEAVDQNECPNLAEDLTVFEKEPGERKFVETVYFDKSLQEVNIQGFKSGNMKIELCKNGLKLEQGILHPMEFSIHKTQLLQIKRFVQNSEEEKSILGRAAVGGLLLGPAGAVVGGLSGTGKKTKTIYYLTIKYWDKDLNSSFCLVFWKPYPVREFMDRIIEEGLLDDD